MSYKVEFRAEIFEENDVYVAVCPELNVSSFGDSVEEARLCLAEAVAAFLEEFRTMGILDEVLEEAGYLKRGDAWIPRRAVREERLTVSA